jgi:hypothetical protein
MITVQLTTTIWAGVPTNRQSFGNRLATLRAYLRRSGRIHFHYDAPGACSLGAQDAQEQAPSGVRDRFRKRMIPYHPANVQLLNRNMVVVVHECAGGFVGKVLPRPLDAQMRLCQQLARLATAIASFHTAGKTTLRLFQFPFSPSIVARIGDLHSVRQGCKRLQSDINADRLASGRQRRGNSLTVCRRTFSIACALRFDIPTNRVSRDIAGCADEIRACPKRWHSPQHRELFAQDVAGLALQSRNDLVRCPLRRR